MHMGKTLVRSGQNFTLLEISGINYPTAANFGDDRLRVFSAAMGQVLGFFIGFYRPPRWRSGLNR